MVDKNIFLTGEVVEELEDCLQILNSANLGIRVIICASGQVLDRINLNKYEQLDITSTRLGIRGKGGLIRKLIEFISFLAIIYRVKPKMIFSGFSMLRYRVASRLLHIPHVAYLRGLLFNSDVKGGYSDGLRYGRLGRFFRSPIFNAYEASHIFTTSEINKKFLLERGIENNKITVIGPVWLEKLKLHSERVRTERGRIILVTQAFSQHGLKEVHECQIADVRAFSALSALKIVNKDFVLRVHPRDFYGYEEDSQVQCVHYDRSTPASFIRQLTSEDLLLAPLSTLAFEADFMGVKVVPILIKGSEPIYSSVFDALGMKPLYLDSIDANKLEFASVEKLPKIFPDCNIALASTVIAELLK